MMLQPALLGGLFIGVLSALPIVSVANCCCLWIVSGGMLAAYLDQQNNPSPTTPGRGAFAGLGAGVVGAVVWLIAAMALDVVMAPLQERVMTAILRNAGDAPPEARMWLEAFGGQGHSVFRYVFGFVAMLFVGAIFSTLGGLLGASFFRGDVPPALGGPPPPIPPSPPEI